MANGDSHGVWRQLTLVLTGVIVSGITSFSAGRATAPLPLSVEQVRIAISQSFTELSSTHSIYVIEGRPRLTAIESNMGRLKDKQDEMLSILHKTQASLDVIQKATAVPNKP